MKESLSVLEHLSFEVENAKNDLISASVSYSLLSQKLHVLKDGYNYLTLLDYTQGYNIPCPLRFNNCVDLKMYVKDLSQKYSRIPVKIYTDNPNLESYLDDYEFGEGDGIRDIELMESETMFRSDIENRTEEILKALVSD